MIDFSHERILFVFTVHSHVLFFDWYTLNEQLFITAVCCRLHWTTVKEGQQWEVYVSV